MTVTTTDPTEAAVQYHYTVLATTRRALLSYVKREDGYIFFLEFTDPLEISEVYHYQRLSPTHYRVETSHQCAIDELMDGLTAIGAFERMFNINPDADLYLLIEVLRISYPLLSFYDDQLRKLKAGSRKLTNEDQCNITQLEEGKSHLVRALLTAARSGFRFSRARD